GGKSYYITIYWYEQQGLPRQDNEHKRWVEVPELGTTEEFPKHPDMNLVLARVKLRENKTIESIDGSMRRYAAHEVGNKTVTSVKIVEADGTSGQDINRGDGIKTTHIQNGAVTFDKISNDVQQKFENVESAAKAYADELLVGHTHIKGDISIDGVLTGNIKKADKPSAIDLSLTNVIYLDYREANVEGNITVLNGVPGTVYYLIVKSNGIHYTFTNVKWPSGIDPIPSADGKRDMYSFICIGPDDYLGTFAFNYD
ncbi:MAG: hypothetical protein GTO45_00035, partial [Candidatus Aminicenantes bacterium]|nr:hypothetical protein [Candidatus Aminicenantes bacterium]NIM77155.1 hypothetical protein [Candidatus Aminicenantes bacterium]NIN16448.1 hypothetical protein [Candidatus Aminicenantes bacterium]NIN40309.1 hypothetical protein [Candidatus Aminicenantes bacterium]NIN83128.1 hypothetical protein [Candidatus Aminicenantes bacterium]